MATPTLLAFRLHDKPTQQDNADLQHNGTQLASAVDMHGCMHITLSMFARRALLAREVQLSADITVVYIRRKGCATLESPSVQKHLDGRPETHVYIGCKDACHSVHSVCWACRWMVNLTTLPDMRVIQRSRFDDLCIEVVNAGTVYHGSTNAAAQTSIALAETHGLLRASI